MISPYILNFIPIGTPSLGYISIAQVEDNIPFQVKRIYWTYYTPNHVVRGHHAHRVLEQVIVAVSGVIDFELENREGKKYNFTLDNPSMGLYIPPLHWRTIRFSHNAVLLCLASDIYNEADYIREYDNFTNLNY